MTAVEWVLEQFNEIHTQRKWKEIIEQALEMEKQQIFDAHENGHNYYDVNGISAEQYYNETFKTKHMTAVEFLFDEVYKDMPYPELLGIIGQAKIMEKQQQGYSEEDLEEAFKSGFTNCYNNNNLTFGEWFEQFERKNSK